MAGIWPVAVRPLAAIVAIGDAAAAVDPTRDPDELLTVEQASALTGTPQRTLRNWIVAGQLPALADRRPTLLRFGDVAAVMANRQRPTAGRMAAGRPMADDEPGTEVSSAARSQLEAIRDDWLLPLVEQIREQAEQIGRLTAERDAEAKARAEAEIFRLAAEQDAALQQRRRNDEARQADQLVNLLEDRIRELERRLRANATSDS